MRARQTSAILDFMGRQEFVVPGPYHIPPIRAELRDKQSRKLVHSWTIAPPARVLGPRSSASFNSAEVDVPKGGDELTVTLGG